MILHPKAKDNLHQIWMADTNENANGLLCNWFSKGSDFSKITLAELAKAAYLLNNRPHKFINDRTPAEVLTTIRRLHRLAQILT